MNIIGVDAETYYGGDYTLSKMTTEEYIRDDRFEMIGISVKVNEDEAEWFSGTHRQTRDFLMQYDWSSALMVAHNNLFDAAILGWRFGIHPNMLACTMAMARAIHISEVQSLSLASLAQRYGVGTKGNEVIAAKGMRRTDFDRYSLHRYGEYCKNDNELCYALFDQMSPLLPVSELRLIDTTLRMFSKPSLMLDVPLLEQHLVTLRAEKERLLGSAKVSKDVLMSNDKLAQLYQSMGVFPPTKTSPTTGKRAWAFAKSDPGFQALLEHENTAVQFVTAARLGVKSTLEETRTERLIGIGKRGLMPVPLRYAAAHTLRWGGEDKINLQNLPRKSVIKQAILAPEGYTIIDCDSSQIEARILAWLAEQDDLVETFRLNNEEIARGVPKEEMKHDPYRIMAADIYGVRVYDVDDLQRFVGKWTILGCLAEGTPVLTDRGWVAIEQVAPNDRLWDGEEWVCHQGVVQKGRKETLNLCGLWLTPDHKVLCGTQWLEAQSVARDSATLSHALATGAVSWLSPDISGVCVEASAPSSCSATADAPSTPWTEATSRISKAPGVTCADVLQDERSSTGSMPPRFPMTDTALASSIGFLQQSLAATSQRMQGMFTMEREASPSSRHGETTAPSSSDMYRPSPDGTTPPSIWTERTTPETTNPEISGSSPAPSTTQIGAQSPSSRRNLMTYDIAFAGPRNRYTVATDAGPLIVHNCGYGMGGLKFQLQLKAQGVEMDANDCAGIVRAYRRKFPRISGLWQQGDRALEALMKQRSAKLGLDGILNVNLLGIRFPNNTYMRYENLRIEKDPRATQEGFVYDSPRGKTRVTTHIYGGKVVENVTQMLARHVVGEQMLMIGRRYQPVLTVHDAVASLVPDEDVAEGRAYIEACMRTRPKWAEGLPLNCESKVGKRYA